MVADSAAHSIRNVALHVIAHKLRSSATPPQRAANNSRAPHRVRQQPKSKTLSGATMIVRRTLLLASLATLVQSYVVPHSRITPVKYRAATEEETAPKPDEIVLGAPFDVAEYPINTDESLFGVRGQCRVDGVPVR